MDGYFFSSLGQPIVSYCTAQLQKKQTLIVTAVVMILHVWAMYNRSRLILGTLLTLFSAEMISTILAITIDSIPRNLPGM
jgi:hypothetical protein